MKIHFIGTGSGKFTRNRFFTSFIIETKGYKILVETGDGIASEMMNRGIDINSINGIVISHLHQDHAGGFAGLIAQMKLTNRKLPLKVFIHSSIKPFLEISLLHSYIFTERLGFKLEMIEYKYDGEFSIDGKIDVLAKENKHLDKYFEYKEKTEIKFSSSSFLFCCNGIKLFYTGDIGGKEDLTLFENHPVTYVLAEVTHIPIKELFEELLLLYPVEKLCLIHIPSEKEKIIIDFYNNLGNDMKQKMVITEDGMNLEVKSY